MNDILVKAYGAFYPVCDFSDRLSSLVTYGNEDPFVFFEKDMIRISFEGTFFPIDEALEILAEELPAKAEGKLDLLDLEGWVMTRYLWKEGAFNANSRGLNDVMAYSGL